MALPDRWSTEEHGTSQDWAAGYVLENTDAVTAYVADHPSVVPLLSEAPRQIVAIFGDVGPPRLRLALDPEIGDRWLAVAFPLRTRGRLPWS